VPRLAALVCIAAIALATVAAIGCGDDTKTVTVSAPDGQTTTRTVPDVKFAKTKFVVHTGLAIGAFKRWIYNPWRAGTFKRGADGRTKALVKAAVAGAFTVHELKSARNAALSNDKLRGLGDKMTTLIRRAQDLLPGLKSGGLDAGNLTVLAAGLGTVTALAKKLGVNVEQRNAPLPDG
jgi:hypothetical protein